MITLRQYTPPTFLLPMGALYKTRQIQKQGFPEHLRNWRFITLTIDRSEYSNEEEAFEVGRRHLREFIYRLKQQYTFARWCWKLEFHQPDAEGRTYPHWHLLIEYKRPIDKDVIEKLWGKGRTQVRGIREDGFQYVFKYVAKAIDEIPDWVGERKSIRLFQTSLGFYARHDRDENVDEPSPRLSVPTNGETQKDRFTETIRERLQRWSRSVVTRTLCEDGVNYRHRVHQLINSSWAECLVQASRDMLAGGVSPQELQIDRHFIKTTCLRHLPSRLFLYNLAHT